MYTRRVILGSLAALGMLAAQEPPASVQVTGAVKQTQNLTPEELAKMLRAPVKTDRSAC